MKKRQNAKLWLQKLGKVHELALELSLDGINVLNHP